MNADESNEFKKVRAFASLPRTVRGFPTVIGSSPKGDKIIYCNGNSVFIVDVENPTNVDIYTEHPVPPAVGQDECLAVFSGSVRDIAWNDDSKRIAAVGEGRERFGHVFLFDTGTSNGNLSGQSRPMSSIDFRPTRPYRLVSGSEDNTVAIFEGPPFKFKTVVLFEGTEGTKTGELVDDSVKGGAAHSGSVFGLAWSPCGQRIATASGDKTVKIWNVPEKALEKVVTFGDSTEDQQIGISWSTKALVSVSLAGFLSFIDPAGNITKVVHGHNKGITSLALTSCKQWLITADFEGHITRWNVSNGESIRIQPTLHRSQVLVTTFEPKSRHHNFDLDSWLGCWKDERLELAWRVDDTVRFTSELPVVLWCDVLLVIDPVHSKCVKLPSQPQGMASSYDGNLTVIACYKNVLVFEDDKLSADLNVTFNPSCAAIFGDLVAVGGQVHMQCHL
ncbi:WD domain, G-beta repeat protein [Ostertagia ostertagi]